MDDRLPALSVIGTPTKRTTILELAAEADRRGFAGLASPGIHGNLALCGSLAHVTSRIPFWSSIQPIYHGHPAEVAVTAGHLAEVSGGRFRLGLGVSHAPAMDRLGIRTGRPLSDMRGYVEGIRAAERAAGALPPIWLATLRDKMLALAVEIADGAIWANAAFSHMPTQLATIPEERRDGFALAAMVPTVIDEDKDAARAIHRRTLSGYVVLPNYRNYWKAAGYEEEMAAVEAALDAGDRDAVTAAMSDRWIDDCTISGGPGEVRERLAAWYDLGVTPIAVMSSTSGGQAHAIGQLFELYAG
jgi:alkanesulfonate monooxygenase SsuD/methylene tetrahydromethanopterin reductase-like flavin-dependent oxidoreductase (luciferase family)